MKKIIAIIMCILLVPVVYAYIQGDASLDGKVDDTDFFILADNFRKDAFDPNSNFDGQGMVDNADFFILADNFDRNAPPTFAQPNLILDKVSETVININVIQAQQLFGSGFTIVPAAGVTITGVEAGEFLGRGIPEGDGTEADVDNLKLLGNGFSNPILMTPIDDSGVIEFNADGSLDVGITRATSKPGSALSISGVSGVGTLVRVIMAPNDVADPISIRSVTNSFHVPIELVVVNNINLVKFGGVTELRIANGDLVAFVNKDIASKDLVIDGNIVATLAPGEVYQNTFVADTIINLEDAGAQLDQISIIVE